MNTLYTAFTQIFRTLFKTLDIAPDNAQYHEYFLSCFNSEQPVKNNTLNTDICTFIYATVQEIKQELHSLNKEEHTSLLSLANKIQEEGITALFSTPPYEGRTLLWQLLCSEALPLLTNTIPQKIEALRTLRKITITNPNPSPITNPAKEILFTSNILLTVPHKDSIESLHIPDAMKDTLRSIIDEPQCYWYDHPMPIGIDKNANEMIYGLTGLSQMLAFEKSQGHIAEDTSIHVLLSVSVTHKGLSKIAKEYLQYELANATDINNLNIYIITEEESSQIANLLQEVHTTHTKNNASSIEKVFGVDGRYGRHYSLLKAIAALWQVCKDPQIRATFKIDLDQIFPQEELQTQSGKSALEHFTTPLWGATAIDYEGQEIELGMIAGGLVNEADIHKGLFTPDVAIPEEPLSIQDIFFPKTLLMSISTRAEIMTRYTDTTIDGTSEALQRVHVTGGTNGILVKSLRTHRPFTPSFIGRAEDQAYLMSVWNEPTQHVKLRYLHAAGLIMRHDKAAFAGEAIKSAKLGTYVGDLLRTILFSRYAQLLPGGIEAFKQFFAPFTSCFSTRIPITAIMGRLFLHCTDEQINTILKIASDELSQEISAQDSTLQQQYEQEKQSWDVFYDTLDILESHTQYQHTLQAINTILEQSKI